MRRTKTFIRAAFAVYAFSTIGQEMPVDITDALHLWNQLVAEDIDAQPREKGGLRNPDNIPKPALAPKAAAGAAESVRAMVGVTIWKLRPSEQSDPADVRLKEIIHGTRQTPARVQLDSKITGQDNLVLAVSATRSGYLYVWSREKYEGGVTRPAKLLFPTPQLRGGNNRIQAGRSVRIPDATDDPAVFTLLRKKGQVSEEVLVVVAPKPLEDVVEGRELSAEQIASWQKQWSSVVRQIDTRKQTPMTPAELQALAGNSREPVVPQRFYELRSAPGTHLMVSVPLTLTE